MSKHIKIVFLLLLVLLSFQPLYCYDVTYSSSDIKVAKVAEDSRWQVYYEGRDESAYRLNVGKYVSGLEIWLFISTDDSYAKQNSSIFDHDYIKLIFAGNPIIVETDHGQRVVDSIIGLSKIGYEGDHEKSVGGLHGIYYVLPTSGFVSYVNITLHAAYSTPRLDLTRSFIREWDPLVDIVELKVGSKGWYVHNVTQDCKGRASIISFGDVISGRPTSSSLTWYFGKRIHMPKLPSARADVYVEVGYAGGINIVPEPPPYMASSIYRCKINVGIGPGPYINYAATSGRQETIYKSKNYPLDAVIEHAAEGCIDIELELLKELASEVGSKAMEKMLERLGYILFVLDIIKLFKSLEFNEVVAKNKILVFKDLPIGESLIAFFNFYAETATLGLTGGIVNFWGECPFGQPLLDFAVDLPSDGGMQIGGILLDYHEERLPENLIFIREDGYVYPPTPLIASDDSRVYRFIGDINTTLIIKRDNIIFDGCGRTLRGGVVVAKHDGYERRSVENVTITSMRIEGGVEYSLLGYLIRVTGIWWGPFIEEIYERIGIVLDEAINAAILNNTITRCQVGIAVFGGKNCTIMGNNIVSAGAPPGLIIDTWRGEKASITIIGIGMGVVLNYVEQTVVSENVISSCEVGVLTEGGITSIMQNYLADNDFGVCAGGMETISRNHIVQCRSGILGVTGGNKVILENTILNCGSGINEEEVETQVLRNRVVNCAEFGIHVRSVVTAHSPVNAEKRCYVSENEVLNCTHGIIVSGLITASENDVAGCTYGIKGFDECTVSSNNIVSCVYGIDASSEYGENVTVTANNVRNCTYGITGSNRGTIGKNVVADCSNGIIVNGPVAVSENIVVNCKYGITRTDDGVQGGVISRNNVVKCIYGISAESRQRFVMGEQIVENNVTSCKYGIVAGEGEVRNTVGKNSVINCTYGIIGGEHVSENNVVDCTYGIIGFRYSNINGNNVINCAYGITASKEALISENNVASCTYGITGGTDISRNRVRNCTYGITGREGSTISENNVVDCANGIVVTEPTYPASIGGNNITRCQKGILVKEKRGVIIGGFIGNNFIKNSFGIYIAAGLNMNYTSTESSTTSIFSNNFIMNNVSIFVEDDDLSQATIYIFNNNFIENGRAYGEPPQCIWSWDLPTGGNYWSDYKGVDEKSGYSQDEPGADGIGDKPYFISKRAVDKYPLMEPFGDLPSITIDYSVREWVITLTSNSVISNFKCNLEDKVVSFYVQGKSGTRGFVSINIPKSIVSGEVEVLFDGRPILFNKSETIDGMNIDFAYEHTKHYVEIRFGVGGAPLQLSVQNYMVFVATAIGLLLIVLLVLYLKKRRAISSNVEPLPPPQ